MQANQIEEVKNKVDIVSLISEYIEVKKAGRNYKANCPFHGEKTPSFMISPEIQMYKCFGCGKSGDCFTFLEEHEGMEFGEALKYLAEKVGVKIVFNNQNEISEKEKISKINTEVFNFYKYALTKHPKSKKVYEYLTKDRGLNDESIKTFNIGYSPEDFNLLSNYLTKKKKQNLNELQKYGVLVGRGIDRFRGRVIFPLFDHKDNIVGFAGRILPWNDQKQAKYINSPDTPLYHKSKVLYGLNVTKGFVRSSGFAVIVEGELDMISSFASGVKNVVAIKGSALTEDQIRLIGRFCNKIILCLDADFAGDEAAKRGAILAVNMGFDVKVATLIGYKDPDEIARKNPESYKKAIEEAEDIWDFLIGQVFKKYDNSTGGGKSHISREITPLLGLIQDKIVQNHYIEKVARLLSVTTESVNEEVSKHNNLLSKDKTEFDKNADDKNKFERKEKSRRELLEEKLIINGLKKSADFFKDQDIYDLISSKNLQKIIDLKLQNKELPEELKLIYAEIILGNSEEENVDLILKELKIISLKEKLQRIGNILKMNDTDKEALQEFNKISKELSAL